MYRSTFRCLLHHKLKSMIKRQTFIALTVNFESRINQLKMQGVDTKRKISWILPMLYAYTSIVITIGDY